jgi:hypothetical protein
MRRWIVIVIVLLLLTWLITGGLVLHDYWTYGGQDQVDTGTGKAFTLWVDTKCRGSWFPPFIVYVTDTLPYSINLTVVDYENSYKKLAITRMTIRFDSGEEAKIILPKDNWSRDFEDYVIHNSTPEGVVRTQTRRLQYTFENVIKRSKNFRLTIRAKYELKTGRLIRASVDQDYKVFKRRYVQTGWESISGI